MSGTGHGTPPLRSATPPIPTTAVLSPTAVPASSPHPSSAGTAASAMDAKSAAHTHTPPLHPIAAHALPGSSSSSGAGAGAGASASAIHHHSHSSSDSKLTIKTGNHTTAYAHGVMAAAKAGATNNQMGDPHKEWSKEELHGKILLFAYPSMYHLASEIVALSRGRIVMGSVSWNHFADDFPNLFIQNAKSIKWADVAFLGSMHTPSVIFEQLSFIYALPRYFAKSLNVILPYFATGTMERVSVIGEVATANSLARMLSMIPLCKTGPAQVCIFDIHTLQNQFYFGDQCLIRLKSCIHLLLRVIKRLPDWKLVTICFPDEGSHKRFATKFKNYPTIVCTKVRDGADRIVRIKEGDCRGRHCIIVDDLVQSGGTMIQCAAAIRAAGGDRVSAYVTHPIFPADSWKRFVDKPDGTKGAGAFDTFWVCNTHPIADQLASHKPFKVLSVAPVAAQVLLDTLPHDPHSNQLSASGHHLTLSPNPNAASGTAAGSASGTTTPVEPLTPIRF